MAKEYFTISQDERAVRIDKYIALKFPEYSRAALTKLFDLNLIKINREPVQPGFKVKPGTIIEYDLGPLQEKPEVIELPVIYEDENVVVVDKPAGIISHARGKFWQEASVASFIRSKITGLEGERGGIVHRLDRATSGVMICAKNEESLVYLQKQFSNRVVEKTYTAVIDRVPKEQKAIISAPIERNLKDPKRFHVSKSGKHAETYYEVTENKDKKSLVILRPKTGRTHQLRLHLDYIGCPIVGDELYGGTKYERLLLHASSLKIDIPKHGSRVFESKPPKLFMEFING